MRLAVPPGCDSHDDSPTLLSRPGVTAFVTALLLFVATQDLTMSTHLASPSASDYIEPSVTVAVLRRIALFLIGVLGTIHAFCSRRNSRTYSALLPGLIGLFVLWCCVSLIWSDDVGSTVRALASSGAVLAFAYGFTERFGPSELPRLVLRVCAMFLVTGLWAELLLGTFSPWSGQYRFAGTMHPNHQAVNCALLVFAGWCVRKIESGRVLTALLITAVAFLLLTKSRTVVAASLSGFAVLSAVRIRSLSPQASGLALCVLGGCTVSAVMIGPAMQEWAGSVISMGREQEPAVEELSGRSQLWMILSEYVPDHALTGYGYNAFWTPARRDEISEKAGWGITDAHSAYWDTLLATGIPGLVIGILLLVGTAFSAVSKFFANPASYNGFSVMAATFTIVHGMTEGELVHASLLQLVYFCCIVAICQRERAAKTAPSPPRNAGRHGIAKRVEVAF